MVSFHFGLPAPALVQRVKAWGARVLSSATTVEEALWLEAQGADAIIAQGLEAGGHRGMFLTDDVTTQMGTLALLPQILGAVNVPVIAAGGITDAAGVAAAMALGAAAPAFALVTAAMAPLRAWGEQQGMGDFSPLWSGQNASGCRPVDAAEVTRSLAQGFDRRRG